MRIDFLSPGDDARHEYCLHCHAEAVEWITVGGKRKCTCRSCGRQAERALVIDPRISWWTDAEGEYWHESAGVFVRDRRGRFLFFQRTSYPYLLTVPAGHVERGEDARSAAARELWEEVGVWGEDADLRLIADEHLRGDTCRRGSDAHRWHAFLLPVDDHRDVAHGKVTVNEEGTSPVWLTLTEARSQELTFAVARIIERHADRLV